MAGCDRDYEEKNMAPVIITERFSLAKSKFSFFKRKILTCDGFEKLTDER